jgi:serine/threonine protein phosphatase PrpC
MERHRLLGRDHEEKGALAVVERPGCCMVLSRGLESPAPKRHLNEDAVGMVESDTGCTVAVVADAHFGRESAEWVVQGVLSQVFRSEGSASSHSFIERVGMSLGMVARQLETQSTESACALVVARVCEQELIWAAFGDCRLFRVSPEGDAQSVTPVEQMWLDGGFRPRELRWGRQPLESGERLLLCTDGLPECRYGIETLHPDALGSLACRGSLAEAAHSLAQEALNGGGEDNIGLVLMSAEMTDAS